MAPVTGRWSRERARDRWAELRIFVGRPLAIGMAVVGLWPLLAIASERARYERPLVAVGIYVASVAIVAGLWWRGRAGISLAVSAGAGVAIALLNVALTLQVPAGEAFGAALWLHAWGAAIPMVLGFSRPIEEPLAVLALLTATNVLSVSRGEQSVQALHNAPLQVAMPIAITVSGLTLVAALRASVANARRSRERTEALAQRERISAAVEAERQQRFASWEREVAPLLEEIANGRSARDPEVGARCRALATAIRGHLSAESESILQALLPAVPGVDLVIRDLDVGHRLVEADRVALVQLVAELSAGGSGSALQVTLQPDGEPGEPVRHALVIIAADGLPQPRARPGGTLTVEAPGRWFYDLTLRCRSQLPSR